MTARNWLITGVSSGFGRNLAEAALARGDTVAGTLRQPAQLAEFEALAPGRAHGVLLDVTDRKAIGPAVQAAIGKLGGQLDVLVNNAGFGMIGALEELDDDQIDDVIEANLMGTIFVTRAALPAIRAAKGAIVNLSSAVGLLGLPGTSTYCAAKFGVEGLSEGLRAELAPLGVQIMVVEPGFFKTQFASTSLKIARQPMAAYDETPARASTKGKSSVNWTPNDPAKLVDILLETIDAGDLPPQLVIGADSMGLLRQKIANLQATEAHCAPLGINQPG